MSYTVYIMFCTLCKCDTKKIITVWRRWADTAGPCFNQWAVVPPGIIKTCMDPSFPAGGSRVQANSSQLELLPTQMRTSIKPEEKGIVYLAKSPQIDALCSVLSLVECHWVTQYTHSTICSILTFYFFGIFFFILVTYKHVLQWPISK